MRALKTIMVVSAAIYLSACGKNSTSYSLLSSSQSFKQSSATQNTMIDILWVIDNSGSMETSQRNLANNFQSFIQTMQDKNYDYKMAVTTTDAYMALPAWTPYYNYFKNDYYEGKPQAQKAKFRDGVGTTHSGDFILTPTTPILADAFITNVMQGTAGFGDERMLQSFKTALDSSYNTGFVRPGGFLAIVSITDEDDFSWDGTDYLENKYTDSRLHTIDSYVSYLDGLTNSSGAARRYSFNTISIQDNTCLNKINNGAQKIGVRVDQMADATGGVKADICGDFANELANISKSIVELSTQFYLHGDPIPETIKVIVNGVEVPNAASNPNGNGGWTYNADANSVVFQGDFIPPQNAEINVSFDPKQLTF